eukprot:5738198-Amphidinium_carterae.1
MQVAWLLPVHPVAKHRVCTGTAVLVLLDIQLGSLIRGLAFASEKLVASLQASVCDGENTSDHQYHTEQKKN